MAKIATLGTRIRARVYAHLTLRYKNPSDFYTQIPSGFVLRYVGAGRKPKVTTVRYEEKDVTLHKPEGFVYRTPKGSGYVA